MKPLDVLREASERIYSRVGEMAGTGAAGGDYGRGAGGDISKGIDVAAEEAVLEHLRGARFACTVLGEECGRVDICGGGPYVVMDAVDGTTNAVRGFPFHCSSLAYAEGDSLGEGHRRGGQEPGQRPDVLGVRRRGRLCRRPAHTC